MSITIKQVVWLWLGIDPCANDHSNDQAIDTKHSCHNYRYNWLHDQFWSHHSHWCNPNSTLCCSICCPRACITKFFKKLTISQCQITLLWNLGGTKGNSVVSGIHPETISSSQNRWKNIKFHRLSALQFTCNRIRSSPWNRLQILLHQPRRIGTTRN
jgi:hypothetical protein